MQASKVGNLPEDLSNLRHEILVSEGTGCLKGKPEGSLGCLLGDQNVSDNEIGG